MSRIGDAREDWKILRALSEVLDKTLPYSSLQGVQKRLSDLAPHLGRVDSIEPPLWLNGQYFKVLDSYLTDPLCCFILSMAECTIACCGYVYYCLFNNQKTQY